MERCRNGSRIVHRSNGVILIGYHIVPEYIEIGAQLGRLCDCVYMGMGGEFEACVSLTCRRDLNIVFDAFGEPTAESEAKDTKWVSKIIKEYRVIDKSDMDKVERAVLLANMLNEKSKSVKF